MRTLLILSLVCVQCTVPNSESNQAKQTPPPYLMVLGNVQDAGSPHAACQKDCCKELFETPDPTRMVVSLGLIEPQQKLNWIFDATPDLPRQMKFLKKETGGTSETPNGIFLTHAHIGHYTGLMFLGRESMNAESVPVFAMPKMRSYLSENGPWSQLVAVNNIDIMHLENDSTIQLTEELRVTPFLVPHRDEYSETVGYKISGPSKSAIFIPDIDKWHKWKKSIVQEISKVDYALLDASFFANGEVGRDMSEIPHPFVSESMNLFKHLSEQEKSKIYFIHFNHTNPLLRSESAESKLVIENGFNIARLGDKIEL